MNPGLTIIFFEDHFVCTILPNESAWEALRVDGAEQVPLFFNVRNGEVRNDGFARERWEAGDPAAFGNFYRIILIPEKVFRRFDLDLPAVELLHDVIERVRVAYIERMRVFDEDLDSKGGVPLRLCFIPGIDTDARERIREYLIAQGFVLCAEIDYLDALFCGLHRKGIVSGTVNLALVDAAFGDMRFDYLECDDGIIKRAREIVPTRGVDQRVGILARLMVEKAARQTTSTLLNDKAMLDEEIKRFHLTAARLVNQFEYDQIEARIELSDYNAARVRITRGELEGRAAEAFHFIKHRFEKFIGEHSNLARTDKILLDGKAIVSLDLVQFFQRSFGTTKVVGPIANVSEIVSRGVFALSQQVPAPERRVEIKITVTTSGPDAASLAPPIPNPKRPSLPPPLPPLPQSRVTAGGSSNGATPPGSSGQTEPARRPPVPPARPPVPKTTTPPPPPPPLPAQRASTAPGTSPASANQPSAPPPSHTKPHNPAAPPSLDSPPPPPLPPARKPKSTK